MTEEEALARVDGYKPAAAPAEPQRVTVPGVSQPDKVAPYGLTGMVTGQTPKASKAEALAEGFKQGGSFGFGDEAQAALDTLVSKVPGLRTVAEKSRGAFARILPGSEHLPVDDPDLTYQQRRDFYRGQADVAQRAHPGYYLGGNLAGGAMTAPIGYTGPGFVPFLASSTAQGAASGLGNSRADLTKGEGLEALRDTAEGGAAGLATGAAAGGVNKFLEGAASRVLKRIPEDVVAGETKARRSLATAVQSKAGEEGNELVGMLQRHPELEKTLATTAKGSPKKAVKVVEGKIGEVGDKLDTTYEAMDKAGRSVTPTDIATEFDKMLGDRLAEGNAPAVKLLRQARADFLNEYGNYGKLAAKTMRGLKATAGKAAGFDKDLPPDVKRQIQADVWKVYSNAIERQAQNTPGVNLDELRALNQDMGQMLSIKNALADRAAQEGRGVMSAGALAQHAASAVAGAAAGGASGHSVAGTILGLTAPLAMKAGAAAARRADFGLLQAQRELAKTGAGQFIANAVQRGVPFGAAVEAAQQAAQQMDEENAK